MKKYVILLYLLIVALLNNPTKAIKAETQSQNLPVTIAILAKDKAHCLPFYLHCIEKQTWPKSKTLLYIRTNNNNDNTAQILKDWIEKVKTYYLKIYFDETDFDEQVQNFGQHEWNNIRFRVLGTIRNESVKWALENHSHYFVCDCDNFILPQTIENLIQTNLPIVSPLLKSKTNYSNYHSAIDQNGYFEFSPTYMPILNCKLKGLIQLPVVHCTYYVNYHVLKDIEYLDETLRHEYVIFSHNARKKNIRQYLDTREVYGYLTFAENSKDLTDELKSCNLFKKEFINFIENYKETKE